MRIIKIRFSDYHNVCARKASEDGSWVEIQGLYGGIIVFKPKLRRTVRHGLILLDQVEWNEGTKFFTDRTHDFESNAYTKHHYRG